MTDDADPTADHAALPASPDPVTLHCMEIWGGCEPARQTVRLPGLDVWVLSQPHRDAPHGGDVHYVSLCGGGLITRVVVADVSGHGAAVAQIALALRDAVRRNINRKSQDRLVDELNRAFAEIGEASGFATAVVATYLAHRDRLTLHNAGHPRPLWYRAKLAEWQLMGDPSGAEAGDLPLGLDDETAYHSLEADLAPGDLVLLYTDALIEARGPGGGLLGEEGLLRLAGELGRGDPMTLGAALLAAVERSHGGPLADDDLTLLVFHHHAGPARRAGILEKFDVYAKVFGLKSV